MRAAVILVPAVARSTVSGFDAVAGVALVLLPGSAAAHLGHPALLGEFLTTCAAE